jgi:hypothetical protein
LVDIATFRYSVDVFKCIGYGIFGVMPAIFERTLVKIGGSYRITLPIEIVKGWNLEAGEVLEIVAHNDEIILRRPKRSD